MPKNRAPKKVKQATSEQSSLPYPLPGRPATDRDTRGFANCKQFAKFAWCAAEGVESITGQGFKANAAEN